MSSTTLILETIAKEYVEESDHAHKIDKWNRYQTALDTVDAQCRVINAKSSNSNSTITFKRNISTNLRNIKHGDLWAVALVCGMFISFVVGIISLAIYLVDSETTPIVVAPYIYSVFYGSLAICIAALIRYMFEDRFAIPSTIKMTCKPELHIDDMTYARAEIRNFPPIQRDPIVHLPTLEITIPRSWLGQQSILYTMKNFNDLKLPETI